METYVKIFLKDLLANRDNLSQYVGKNLPLYYTADSFKNRDK